MHNKLLHFKFRSFTLIELLVVITVIGVLSTVVFVSISKVLPQVKDNKITQDFHQLLNLAENTYSEKANYDSLCQGEIPCNQELQSIYEDIEKQKGTLVIQKLEPSSQSYCAFSPLNSLTEEDKTQYYCIANSAEKIKTTINPGIIHCTNVSFRCPTQEEQLAFEEKGEGVGITLPSLTAQASVFAISTKTYPYFREVTIDPLDVRPGDIQTIMVKVEDPDEINWIRADIEHDNGVDTVMLALIEGDLKSGTWYGRWLVYDTHKETYHTTFTAQNRKGKQNSITLAWTDSCPFPLSGNTSLSAMGGSCEIATTDPSKGVNGVDNGNFTVDGGYTLTIKAGATMVFNPGKSITISNGSIAIEKNGAGGQMRKTYLWMTDQDNDGYSATSTQYAQDNTPTNGKRRYLITSAALDYDDTSNLIYPETACLSSSASTSDSFTDETKIASTSNVSVSGGQVKSELSP